MAKMRTMQHNSRANSQGRTHGTKHNDRDFDTDLADNINKEKSKDNVYWHLYQAQDPGMTFDQAELKFYVETFGEQLQRTNDNYLRQSHPERCKSMPEWKMARQNAPEETVMQIGKMEEHVDPEILMACFQDYNQRIEAWNEDHGRPFTLLTYALHVDEAVPHIQARRVWHYEDAKGQLRIGQEKALAAAGVELPDPSKSEGRRNNRKMTFDKMARDLWLDVLHEHGLDIERIPVPDGKHNREKEEMIRDKYKEISAETARLQEKKQELDTQLQERNLDYNKAVGQEIESRMDPLPERIERKPAPLSKGKVIVSEEALDDLERRAALNTAHKETMTKAEEQLADKTANADAYIEARVAQLRASLEQATAEAKEQKRTMLFKEGEYHFAAAEARQARIDASASKNRYEEKYRSQLQLNKLFEAAQSENKALKAENEDLKKNESQRVQKAVEAATAPLQEQIKAKDAEIAEQQNKNAELNYAVSDLYDKLQRVALVVSTLISAIKYVADRIAGRVSKAILDATARKGERWLAEIPGYKNRIPASALHKAIEQDIHLDLIYRANGSEGKGVYTKEGILVANVRDLKDARERFAGCRVAMEKSNEHIL